MNAVAYHIGTLLMPFNVRNFPGLLVLTAGLQGNRDTDYHM
ncbi:hypothetical protein [Ferrovum myxofaciens]|jgi:hypothetical protein|nr:hypothetical protein [Ferrovum myxofaciens]